MPTKIGLLYATADISVVEKILSELRALESINVIRLLKPSSIEVPGTAMRLMQADILLVFHSSSLFPEIRTATSDRSNFIVDHAYKSSKAVVPIYLDDIRKVSLPEFLFHIIGFYPFSKNNAFPLDVAHR